MKHGLYVMVALIKLISVQTLRYLGNFVEDAVSNIFAEATGELLREFVGVPQALQFTVQLLLAAFVWFFIYIHHD